MVQIDKEWILEELSKPLPYGHVINTDILRDRLGIPKNHTDNDWLELCKTIEELRKDGLVSISENDETYRKENLGKGEPFLYANSTINYQLHVTSAGTLWLAQMKGTRAVEKSAAKGDIASGNLSNNKTQVGLLNIGSIFSFENFKFEGGLFGGKRTQAQMELGVIFLIIEIVGYGILNQIIPNNQILTWIILGLLLITGVIFFGAENSIKNLMKQNSGK